jgi:Tfp pilus assembly protein PilF
MSASRLGGVCLAAGLTFLTAAGCQQLTPKPALGPAPLVSNDGAKPQLGKQEAADVKVAMGRALERQGKLDQALEAYEKAIERDPARADAWWRMAIVYDRQGNFKESEERYRRALAMQPSNAEFYCDYGYSLYLQHRYSEAEGNLTRALSLNGRLPRAHNNLALVLCRTDRLEPGLAEFNLGGNAPAQAHVNAAFALTLDGRWDEAREQYERALAIDPACEPARIGLGNVQRLCARARPGYMPGTVGSPSAGTGVAQASYSQP